MKRLYRMHILYLEWQSIKCISTCLCSVRCLWPNCHQTIAIVLWLSVWLNRTYTVKFKFEEKIRDRRLSAVTPQERGSFSTTKPPPTGSPQWLMHGVLPYNSHTCWLSPAMMLHTRTVPRKPDQKPTQNRIKSRHKTGSRPDTKQDQEPTQRTPFVRLKRKNIIAQKFVMSWRPVCSMESSHTRFTWLKSRNKSGWHVGRNALTSRWLTPISMVRVFDPA